MVKQEAKVFAREWEGTPENNQSKRYKQVNLYEQKGPGILQMIQSQ
jgi:hypothetical protein